MNKIRLDHLVFKSKLLPSRSQAENYIKLGKVKVNGEVVLKPGYFVDNDDTIEMDQDQQYVSRGALKMASAADKLGINFKGATILDVGSSTGGFTDYVLQNGAVKVIAVDVGSDQMNPNLRQDPRVELHEKTDIRNFPKPDVQLDWILIDVSFISLRNILPHITSLAAPSTKIAAMVKPQFEAQKAELNKGVVKNDTIRRHILNEFEAWAKKLFIIESKADNGITGEKGNLERFYILHKKFDNNKLLL